MSALLRKLLLLKFSVAVPNEQGLVLDAESGQAPIVWRSADLQVNVCAFDTQATPVPLDITAFTNLTLELRPEGAPDRADSVYWSKTVAKSDSTLTAAEFTAGTKKHAQFTLTDDEMRIDLGDANAKKFWIVLAGLTTTGAYVVIASGGSFSVVESGFNSGGSVVSLVSSIGTGTVDAGEWSETVAYPGMTTAGYVFVQKTGDGPAIDKVTYAADQFTVWLTGPAPAGGVTFQYDKRAL